MHRKNHTINSLLFLICWLGSSCQQQKQQEYHQTNNSIDLPQIVERSELTAITIENSFSNFSISEKQVNYECALCLDYAESINVKVKFIVADNPHEMIQMLLNGKGDLIVYPIPINKKNESILSFSNNRHIWCPVIIQSADDTITDVTQLIGRKVYTRKNSRYWNLLNNLNQELGGGIEICESDSYNIDELIEKVSENIFDLTLASKEIAAINRRDISFNSSVEAGLSQESGWAFRKNTPKLLNSVNHWYAANQKYYKNRQTKNTQPIIPATTKNNCQISPYDELFKQNAGQLYWGWQLLAAIACHESNFNPEVISYAGAIGLMQLMPSTAAKFNIDSVAIFNPCSNIKASVAYIEQLNKNYKNIDDENERIKFILAAYNSGSAHVDDAIALAKKYGYNPKVWSNSVEYFFKQENKPEYYNDPVCKSGYFRANHTVRYVKDVLKTYKEYKKHTAI